MILWALGGHDRALRKRADRSGKWTNHVPSPPLWRNQGSPFAPFPSACSYHPEMVSQFSPVPLQHLLSLWPSRLSIASLSFSALLFLSLKNLAPATIHWSYTPLFIMLYSKPFANQLSLCPRLSHPVSRSNFQPLLKNDPAMNSKTVQERPV